MVNLLYGQRGLISYFEKKNVINLLNDEKITLSEKLNILGINNSPVDCISIGINKIKKLMKPKDITLIFGTHYIASEVFSEFEISFDSGVI